MKSLSKYGHTLFMALLLAGAIFAYTAWYGRISKESALAVSIQNDVQAKQQSAARIQESKSALDRALTDESSIRTYFVPTKDVVTYLEDLQQTGAKLGTKVDVASVSSEPATPHAVLVLALSIEGSFDAVMRTLGAIEYQPYDTQITNLTFDTTDTSSSTRKWSASVSVRVGTIDAPPPVQPLSTTTPTDIPVVATTSTMMASSSATVATTSTVTSAPMQSAASSSVSASTSPRKL
jgi:hypothetical protein